MEAIPGLDSLKKKSGFKNSDSFNLLLGFNLFTYKIVKKKEPWRW